MDELDDSVYDTRRSPSPPHASGGAYYPPPGAPAATPATHGFTQHPNMASTNIAQPPYPYSPNDYPEYHQPPPPGPPVPPGPPPNSAATSSGFPPPPTGPDHVSAVPVVPPSPQDASLRHGIQDVFAL